MTMVDYQRGPPPHEMPHRKPIAAHTSRNNDLRPLTKIHPDVSYTSSSPSHHTTTTTSTYQAYPPRVSSTTSPAHNQSPYTSPYNNPMFTSRRTPSQSTTNSSINYQQHPPTRTPSNVSSKISRTSSTRTTGSATSTNSYVALMRKQKATVWCDRSQHEDPRIVAQQKAAKIRAAREITLRPPGDAGRTSTSGSMGSGSLGVRSKIRHHGVPKASGYNSANMAGGGVPMRLSANEVGDEGTYNGNPTGAGASRVQHGRTGSAHSRDSRFLTVDTSHSGRRYSQGSATGTPLSGQGSSGYTPELAEETPLPTNHHKNNSYFSPSQPSAGEPGGSAGSSERENSFGKFGKMEGPAASAGKKKEGKSEEELRRRGSVDERANTMGFMGGGRLFVANPDLSD